MIPGAHWSQLSLIIFSLLIGQQTANTSTKQLPEGQVTAVGSASIATTPNFSDHELARKATLKRCLAIYYTRQVNADILRPWSIMHGLIAYGQQARIIRQGQRVSAVEYLCANGIGDDRRLLFVDKGKLQTKIGRGVQGHAGQLLAMFAQTGVAPNQPIRIQGYSYSVKDLIKHEQHSCRPATELTFKLLGLSHYLPSDSTWTSDDGQRWDIARLVAEELRQPINGASCGGTHRLMALSYAVRNRVRDGKPVNGVWLQAADQVAAYHKIALNWQNSDGSFSTKWFEQPEASRDAKRRLYTTGHILEWLVYSMPQDRMRDPKITRAVDYLLTLMLSAPDYQLDVGPRGHALHALRMYEEAVFGASNHRHLMTVASTKTQLPAVDQTRSNQNRPSKSYPPQRRRRFRRK